MFRKVPSLTYIESPVKRAYINLAGCNFRCRGCFAIARDNVGWNFSVDKLLRVFTRGCKHVWGYDVADQVVVTGGEPTLNRKFLLKLIERLKRLGVPKIELSTNGYMLDRDYIGSLKSAGVDLVKIDVKAYTGSVHEWYTGKDNVRVLKAVRLLYESGIEFYVRTIMIPEVVGVDEIARIAKFLASIGRDVRYRIYQFASGIPKVLGRETFKPPRREDIIAALNAAREYLEDVDALVNVNSYRSDWRSVEFYADELAEVYRRVAAESVKAIKDWGSRYRLCPMSKLLIP